MKNIKHRIALIGMVIPTLLLGSPAYSKEFKELIKPRKSINTSPSFAITENTLPDYAVTKGSIIGRKIISGLCNFRFQMKVKNIGGNGNATFKNKIPEIKLSIKAYDLSGALIANVTFTSPKQKPINNTYITTFRSWIPFPENGKYKVKLSTNVPNIPEKNNKNNIKFMHITVTDKSCYKSRVQGVPNQKIQGNSIPRKPGKLIPRSQGKPIYKLPSG